MLYLFVFAGFVLLMAGGEILVRGAVALAARLGVSPLVIGLTVVGFGTSTPELVTSLDAALSGAPGIAVGNVIGSNTANILLILGIAALMAPIVVDRAAFLRDGGAAMAAALAALAVVMTGALSRPAGAALILALIVYLWLAFRRGRVVDDVALDVPQRGPVAAGLLAAGGIALTILGARLLVHGATGLAEAWGVSEAVIGVTVVAVGTSLPELATSIVAALKREGDIAFGNVVGSNIYNVFGILGATALVRPIPVPPEIASFDIWVMLAATVALTVVAVTGWRITRAEGGVLVAAYLAYCAVLFV